VNGNQAHGKLVNRFAQWAAYDALPPRVRRLLQQAPYDYDTVSVRRMHQDCMAAFLSEQRFVRTLAESFLQDRDKEIRAVWGADHPMIGARPKGWS
jgi:hypothetical protein